MGKIAIYAVSGDPWTKGHTDIVERSLQVFDKVVVAIGVNPKKNYTFPLEMRKKLAGLSLQKFGDRVEIDSFEGLLVDYAYTRGVKILIRGMRDDLDFNYEKGMFQVNITQKGIDEFFLFPNPKYEHISSSAVRELQANQGNIIDYVDLSVKQALEVNMGQYIVGVTGMIGAGKTYLTDRLCNVGENFFGSKYHHIDLDVIARKLLTEDTRHFAKQMRLELMQNIAGELVNDVEDFFINIAKLKAYIFSSGERRRIYNEITREPILHVVRQQMRKVKTGYFFLNSALLAEAELMSMCNNNVVIVVAEDDFRSKNLEFRGYTPNELANITSAQMSQEGKIEEIKRCITQAKWGSLTSIMNCPDLSDDYLFRMLEQIRDITGKV